MKLQVATYAGKALRSLGEISPTAVAASLVACASWHLKKKLKEEEEEERLNVKEIKKVKEKKKDPLANAKKCPNWRARMPEEKKQESRLNDKKRKKVVRANLPESEKAKEREKNAQRMKKMRNMK